MNKGTTQSHLRHIANTRTIVLLSAFTSIFLCGVGVGVYHRLPVSVLNADKATAEPKLAPPQQVQKLYKAESKVYTLPVSKLSYYALDAKGEFKFQNSSLYEGEGVYQFDRTIHSNSTAIVIMDPWIDMPTKQLNEHFGKVTESHIIPLVKQALMHGHPIIVLTNKKPNPNCCTKIHPKLQALVEDGKASVLFHDDLDADGFATYLHSQGIGSLIYTGFASNICIMGRPMGITSMRHKVKVFFMPEASAALEYADTWQDQAIHKATTQIISQDIAEIIDYDDFMKASVASK